MSPLVLSVDDYEDDRLLLTLVIEGLGCNSLGAADGHSALVLAKQHRPDLILLDLRLPDLDGVEVARRLKAHSHTQHIPILAVTASALECDRTHALAAGCDGYLIKPYSIKSLESLILSYCGQQSQQSVG